MHRYFNYSNKSGEHPLWWASQCPNWRPRKVEEYHLHKLHSVVLPGRMSYLEAKIEEEFFLMILHCFKSELYLAKWKWILRSGPKLKMLVKFHRSSGSFPTPLDWWRIRFGCTELDQCYWNKEKWFANWRVGWPRSWSAAGEILLQLILYLHARLGLPPNIKQTVLCIQGDSIACHQITKLRL